MLVVEDDEDVRELVVMTLSTLGYRVLGAADGREALSILRNGEPVDLLFTDVVMPQGLSGIDLAKEARRQRSGVEILLTTGYARQALAQDADEEIPILQKPYRREDLADEIHRVLTGTSRETSQ